MSQEETKPAKPPSLFRNYISLTGTVVAIACAACIVLLFLMELLGNHGSPYLGIFTYIIFPTVLVMALFVIPIGAFSERRRRRKLAPGEIAAYPKLDLNDPHKRKMFFVFLGASFMFIFVSAFGSYKAFQYTEEVSFCGQTCHTPMKPEFTAYLASPHARVRCVDCHVGEGAGWYVRSKISGAYQLYSVTFNKYSRPIKSPVHNLRPAPETCEQCHWPEKFFGAQMKTFNHYAYDEKNSLRQTRMLINVGGGSPATGQVAGIHWHMNIANEITYISTDEQRQSIPWVRIKDRTGRVTEYMDRNKQLTTDQLNHLPSRRMDCVDCHNRPAHIYLPPDVALDQAFFANRLDVSLPFLKRETAAAISDKYSTTDQALNAISSRLDTFYKNSYPAIYSEKRDAIRSAITETQRIFQTYTFPEMNTNFQTHPNNIGHLYSQGCFRCHDGEHVSSTGQVIRNDCNICHTVIYDSAARESAFKLGSFQHPVDLGALGDRKCTFCHKGNKPFQHPVNLGDISQFQCVECHPKKK
ncbi:MAG: cytochrome C [Blastocatellia bacterium]|nr:MAG: cytochrome C [Blastocatellia bacterium]